MNTNDSSHRPAANHDRATPWLETVMPQLTHEQMLAILCESGVPENEARRWVEREASLARDGSARSS